jgi:hypothetical protein
MSLSRNSCLRSPYRRTPLPFAAPVARFGRYGWLSPWLGLPAFCALVCHLLGSVGCSRVGEPVAAVLHDGAPAQTAALEPPSPPEGLLPEQLSEAGLYLPGTLELDPQVV